MHANADKDTVADEKSLDIAQAYIQSYANFTKAVKNYGPHSNEADETFRIMVQAQKRFHKRLAQNRERKAYANKR